jgi:DNA-binding transcriptional regulator YhcF (GntR family)
MQQPEFNNLMQGFPSKWAPLNSGNKEVTKAEVKKMEVEISPKVRDEMDQFIAEHRKIGTKERTIRRLVKTRWNIKVI